MFRDWNVHRDRYNIKINVLDSESIVADDQRKVCVIFRETDIENNRQIILCDGQYNECNIVTGGFHFSFPIICHFRMYVYQVEEGIKRNGYDKVGIYVRAHQYQNIVE